MERFANSTWRLICTVRSNCSRSRGNAEERHIAHRDFATRREERAGSRPEWIFGHFSPALGTLG